MNDFAQRAVESQFQALTALPWLLLVVLISPLVVAAFVLKIYPTRVWIILMSLATFGSVLCVFWPGLVTVVAIFDALVLIVAVVDFLCLYPVTNHGIDVQRNIARTCSLGVPVDSFVQIENRTPLTLHGSVADDVPDHFASSPPTHELKLPTMGNVIMKRRLLPQRRGAFSLQHVYLRFKSPLKMWERHRKIALQSELNVYPDMKQLTDYALLARTNRLSLIGVRKTRRIGQDSDFERLRDYTRDDNYRHIDWRSTARRSKLTVRQFQSDQSQRVIFLLDCGRMMTNERDGYSLLDHALNSALMMAYVALSQGDAVGMLCFSDSVHSYIPPRSGKSQMNRLIHAGFDQFPRMVESRYDQAFLYLSNHCKRRSLVVLATNVVDEVNAGAVVDYLSNISGQHLPLGVILRDRQMFDAADSPDGDEINMYRAAAASNILLWRDQVLRDLHHRGVLLVDAFPDELTAPLVNQYLNVKAKHLL
ncbi:DUF58 domain-containing protein [Stieleria varia]|uniref:DUF58 domain-containing protein n=1 Tax=Stieleria varia TaxID=2528005 RepID=A0A5C6AXR9_9BACT|nr:DUF58 domain-containing protein [Stieleria varia]TWU04428.1 hypothetical protein Pla52n_24690 [Stieleria varia]